MDAVTRRRLLIIGLHLAIPVLILALIVAAGESAKRAGVWTVKADSGWKKLEEGLELRTVGLTYLNRHQNGVVSLEPKLTAVRVDTRRFRPRALVNPVKDGRDLAKVAAAEEAPLVLNGGYFGHENEPVTLLISGGKLLREATESLPLSGALVVDARGRAAVAPMAAVKAPYRGVDFAVQNSPMLVRGSRVCFPPPPKEPTDPEQDRFRRTAAGVDFAGRVVFTVCDTEIGLGEWAVLLAMPENQGGLQLRAAVNLDGGPSSGMAVNHGESGSHVKAGRTIPYVIVVDRRPEPVNPEKPPEGPEGEFVPVRPG